MRLLNRNIHLQILLSVRRSFRAISLFSSSRKEQRGMSFGQLSVSTGISQSVHSCMNREGLHSVCHTLGITHANSHKLYGSWRHTARLPDLGKLVSSSGTSSFQPSLSPSLVFPLFVFSLRRLSCRIRVSLVALYFIENQYVI